MSEVEHQIIIVPCSGIGKTFGEVTRQAAYEVAESLRPDETRLAALSLLVMGDEQAQTAVAESPVLAIDGCRSACATKMVRESGAAVTTLTFSRVKVNKRLPDDAFTRPAR